jgi:hypothetical protein
MSFVKRVRLAMARRDMALIAALLIAAATAYACVCVTFTMVLPGVSWCTCECEGVPGCENSQDYQACEPGFSYVTITCTCGPMGRLCGELTVLDCYTFPGGGAPNCSDQG